MNQHEIEAFRAAQSGNVGASLRHASRGVRARARQAAKRAGRKAASSAKRVGKRALRAAMKNLKKQFNRLQKRRRKYMEQLRKRRAKRRAGKGSPRPKKPRTEVSASEVPEGAVIRQGKRGGKYYVSETGQKVYVKEG